MQDVLEAPIKEKEENKILFPEITENFVDIKGTFYKKNPKVAKRIPGFIYRYLQKITHEKYVNEVLYKYRDYEGQDFMHKVLIEEFNISIKVNNIEYLKFAERPIVAANHPLGGLDGTALMYVCGKVNPKVLFPVNDVLMGVPQMRSMLVPINKIRKDAKKDNINNVSKAFASDAIIPFFPSGMVSRKKWFKGIKDLRWKRSFLIGARENHRDVVLTHINGRNSNFFYNLANFRKFFRVKMNLEMVYLINEMVKQKNKTIEITFSKPFKTSELNPEKDDTIYAEEMREFIYELGKNKDAVLKK